MVVRENKVRPNQAGFRPGRDCADQNIHAKTKKGTGTPL